MERQTKMKKNRGFTLIEILVVVAIVGILAAVAIPGYQNQVRKSNRASAQAFMMDIASRQQLNLQTAREYQSDYEKLSVKVPDTAARVYTFKIDVTAGPPPTFVITATPKTGTIQAHSTEPEITLNEKGDKTPTAKW